MHIARQRGLLPHLTTRIQRKQRTLAMYTMKNRLLYNIAVLAVLIALLLSPQIADAIITPDEPTPPKSTPSTPPNSALSSDSKSPPSAKQGDASLPAGGPSAAPPAIAEAPVPSNDAKSVPTSTATTGTNPASAPTERTAANTGDRGSSSREAAEKSTPSTQPTTAPMAEVIHERYVRERGAGGDSIDDDELDDRDLFGHSSVEIEDSDADEGGGGGSGKRQNYASLDAGATILDSSPELKSPTNLLVPDKDRYMLMPCEKPRKWVVVSLSEDVHADAIAVANYEKFSSTVKEFIVLGSVNYPTDTWFVLGNFTAAHQNGEQIFPLDSQHHVRYIKLRFFSHYGSEYYCTLSQLKVYGRTFTQVISQLEKSIDAEATLDVLTLPEPNEQAKNDASQAGSQGGGDSGRHDSGHSEVETSDLSCLRGERSLMEVAIHQDPSSLTCSLDDAPRQTPVKQAPFLAPSDRSDDHSVSLTPRELAELEALGRQAEVGTSTPTTNSTASSSATSSAKSNASSVPSGLNPSSTTMPQGLGRLESIFVRITKKIQQLELNQTTFLRQLEEIHSQQKALAVSLHGKQDTISTQIEEIRAILSEMSTRMELESLQNMQYRRLVDELRKENAALWNEMLIVREVITTMKAGILCALILSACIIVFYLLRLLFRCIQSAKKRADLREWFWRMESMQQELQEEESPNSPLREDSEPVGAWRLNYKNAFGSSYDDLAIERKTLLRELVGDASSLHTLDGAQRNKRARTASLMPTPKLKDLISQMEKACRDQDEDIIFKKEENVH